MRLWGWCLHWSLVGSAQGSRAYNYRRPFPLSRVYGKPRVRRQRVEPCELLPAFFEWVLLRLISCGLHAGYYNQCELMITLILPSLRDALLYPVSLSPGTFIIPCIVFFIIPSLTISCIDCILITLTNYTHPFPKSPKLRPRCFVFKSAKSSSCCPDALGHTAIQ